MPRILIVEDNEENRDSLSRRLQRRGFEVITAVDGNAGLASARQDRPDLILMDMNMPELDGWETTRRIKETEGLAGVPVLAITAHALAGDEERARQAGCIEYHTKPMDFPKLVEQIQDILKDRGDRVNTNVPGAENSKS